MIKDPPTEKDQFQQQSFRKIIRLTNLSTQLQFYNNKRIPWSVFRLPQFNLVAFDVHNMYKFSKVVGCNSLLIISVIIG
jgi:hypothetical protein